MITPINSQIVIEYQLSDKDINMFYPITPEGRLNMDDIELQRYPNYDINWSFDEAIVSPFFPLILFERLGYMRHLDTAKVISVSKQISQEYSSLIGQDIILSNVDATNSLAGLKYEMDYQTGKITAIINPKQIMATKLKNNTLKPIHNYVELEFNFTKELEANSLDTGLQMPAFQTKDGRTLDANTLEAKEFLEIVKDNLGGLTISQTVPTVSAVYSKNAQVKVGDKVLIVNDYGFQLDRVARIDLKKKKLYFIKPETIILGIEND